eukprot:s560_g4.t1
MCFQCQCQSNSVSRANENSVAEASQGESARHDAMAACSIIGPMQRKAGRSRSNRYCLNRERPSNKGSSNAPGRTGMTILDMGCKQRVQEAFEHLMSVLATEEDRLQLERQKVEEQKQEANLQTKMAQDLMCEARALLQAVQQHQAPQPHAAGSKEAPAPSKPAEAAFATPAPAPEPKQDLPPGAPAAKAPTVKAPPAALQQPASAPAPPQQPQPPYQHWAHSDQVTFNQSVAQEPNGTKDPTSASKMFQSPPPNFKAPPEAVQKAPPAPAADKAHPWEVPVPAKKAPPVCPQQAAQQMPKKAPPPQLNGQPQMNGQQAPTKKAPPVPPPTTTGMDLVEDS